ncbi:MAG: Fe-S protein assembly co-chaperone HscB [Chitinophagaceae bacterium]|nr:Fe-S protein assembly co-chaperone HscB [Chitinophagaceae bacterium]
MTYFELFDIPVQLTVNPALLSRQFFALSRQFHPDLVAKESEAVQAEALETSALLNKAWKTFQHPDEVIKYVLQLKGLLEEEEKYELPPAFLMEVMDINEALMDADGPDAVTGLQSSIDNLQSEIYAPVKEIIENYREGVTTEKELLQVKEYYYKKKYIDRIRKELDGR